MAKNKKLLGVQIYKINEEKDVKDLISSIKTEYKIIDDLNDKYLVEVKYTTQNKLDALEHEEVHPLDQYELSESIVEIGKELGIKINVQQDPTGIDPEAVKKFKVIALSKIKKAKEKEEGPGDGN